MRPQVHQDHLRVLSVKHIAAERKTIKVPVTKPPHKSSGSTDRQAREALQIGELLGLKIVQNKEAVVSTIKRSLRRNSKRLQQSSEKPSKSRRTNKAR